MVTFSTLYYDVRCKIYIKGAKTYKVLNRKKLRLDYEENKKIIQDIPILSLFDKEIKGIKTKYSVNDEDIVIKEIKFEQVEDINNFITFTVKGDRVIVHTIDEESYNEDTTYLIEVLNGSIKIIINNYNPKYIYQFKCGNIVDNFDYDEYYFFYPNNNFTFEILTYYHDILINTIVKDIELNTINLNTPIIIKDNNKENIHTNSLKLFNSGIEDIDKLPYLVNTTNNETFDIKASIKGLTESKIEIYPKVTTSYDINCLYDYQIDEVVGSFSYSANVEQYGTIKYKMLKMATDALRVNYNINCRVTFFEQQNNGYKTWVTKDVTLSRQQTFDFQDEFFLADTISFSDTSLTKIVDNLNVYSLMNDKAKSMYSIGSNYTLHSFSINNIKNYKNNILTSDENIIPLFYTPSSNINSSNSVDTSKPIKFLISANCIYSGEKTGEAVIGKAETTLTNSSSFNFPITNCNGEQYTSNRFKNKVIVISAPSYIKYSINGETLKAWSTKDYSATGKYEFNNNFKSVLIKLQDELKISSTSENMKATVVIKCLSDSIYFNNTKYTTNQTKTLTMEGRLDSLLFGVTGTCIKVTKTEKLRLPEDTTDVYRASINGNDATYMTALKGKEDYNQKEEPFIIPPIANNIRYSINTFNTIPKEATITKAMTQTSNHLKYSMLLKLSSSYKTTTTISDYTLLDNHIFKDYNLVEGYIKTYTLTIPKPTSEKPSYQLYLESTNPNILLEYNKNITFTGSNSNVSVKCYATKHPACNWNMMIPSSYCYLGEDEYFTYNRKLLCSPVDEKISIGKRIITTNPVCIMNDGITLQRVISTENDGITIKEVITSDNNYFYTTYKNIKISKVVNVLEEEIAYTPFSHYLYADCNECTVYYKVADSFDYTVNEASTVISLNTSHNGVLELYYNDQEFIQTNVSLNPLHSNISSGSVFISEEEQKILSHKIHYSNYDNVHCYNVELLDKYNNPVSNISNPVITNLGAGTSIIFYTRESTNGVITIKLKSNTSIRREIVDINGYKFNL